MSSRLASAISDSLAARPPRRPFLAPNELRAVTAAALAVDAVVTPEELTQLKKLSSRIASGEVGSTAQSHRDLDRFIENQEFGFGHGFEPQTPGPYPPIDIGW